MQIIRNRATLAVSYLLPDGAAVQLDADGLQAPGIHALDVTAATHELLQSIPAPAVWAGSALAWDAGWVVLDQPALDAAAEAVGAAFAKRQSDAWERIKHERDKRSAMGVKVGAHWYHSDANSRIQQLSLFVMGPSVPPVQWKTLTLSPPPVFVTMTQAIAGGIFQNTAASDAAIFAAAETHRVAMEASNTPESYDFSAGWPVSIEEDL